MRTNGSKGDNLCGAKTKGNTQRSCRNTAGERTNHVGFGRCWKHGGTTPTGERFAATLMAQAELRHGFGREKDVEPHEALCWCIRLAAGELEYATLRVSQLEANELIVTAIEEHDRPLNLGKEGEDTNVTVTEVRRLRQELNVWIKVQHDASDRVVRYATSAMRAGLEERLVQVAEAQGKMLATAIEGVLRELGVADDPRAPAIVRKQLLQIAERSSA